MQPYPMFDIEDMTKGMGYAVAGYDDFPQKFNRTSSILFDNKQEIENLHKLFPILVRYPFLMPLAPRAIKSRIMARSEERRVGKECTSWCRSRWSPYH